MCVGTLLCCSCMNDPWTNYNLCLLSPVFKCMFVIIIVLLFLSVLGIPLAIVMIVDRCKAMKVHHHKSLHHYCGHLWYHFTNYGDFTFICTSYISQSKDSSDKNFADRIKLQYVDLIQGILYSCILSWCALTWSCLCMCYDIEKCMKTKNKSRTVPDGRYTCICKYTVGTGTYHPEKKKKKKKEKKKTFCLSIHRPTLWDEFCVSNVFLSLIFCFWLIYQMQRKLTVSRADPDKWMSSFLLNACNSIVWWWKNLHSILGMFIDKHPAIPWL